jgi:NADH dehydrogenase FAD-containing subunit
VNREQIVILGGGTGGTMTANRIRRYFDADEAAEPKTTWRLG